MFDFGLDFVDAGNIELGTFTFFPNRFGGFFRNGAELSHRVGGVRLDLEPNSKFCLW